MSGSGADKEEAVRFCFTNETQAVRLFHGLLLDSCPCLVLTAAQSLRSCLLPARHNSGTPKGKGGRSTKCLVKEAKCSLKVWFPGFCFFILIMEAPPRCHRPPPARPSPVGSEHAEHALGFHGHRHKGTLEEVWHGPQE